MISHFKLLLTKAISKPESRLGEIAAMLVESDRKEEESKQKQFSEARRRILKDLKVRDFPGMAS
jgi:hypothetical protein